MSAKDDIKSTLIKSIWKAGIKELMFGEHNFYENLTAKILMLVRESEEE